MAKTKLFTKRKFLPLFGTQFFGAFNDNFLKNAMVILITFRSASVLGLPPSQIVVLSGGIFILPFFLFSALAGQIADKFEKTTVIKFVKWTELGIMLLATSGLLTQNFVLLLGALFMMGLHSTFFGPIKYSILPQHLEVSELVSGNASIEAGTFIAILLGTIGGGLLIRGADGPKIVSFGLLLVAGFGLASCYWIPKAPAVDPDLKVQLNPFPETWAIFKFAHQTHSVFLSILGISWFWFYGAALLSLFAPLCKDVLHSDETLVTTLLAVFSIGTATGSILCERLSRDGLELGLVPFGSAGISVFGALLYFLCDHFHAFHEGLSAVEFAANGVGIAILLDLFALSMFAGFFIVPMYTLMQERSELKQRSRIIAANNILNSLFMVGSALFLSLLLSFHISIPMILLILAALNMFVSLYIYLLMPEFLFRFLAWLLANLLYRLKVHGNEHIPKAGPAVLVCNHVSFVDWLIIMAEIKRPVRFVMDKSYFKGFFIRRLMIRGKVIRIASAKEDPATLEKAYEHIRESLREGVLVCIFPEGTITRSGQMNPFRPGILKIIEDTPVPVVPMALNGLWGSFFSRRDKKLVAKRPRKFWSRISLKIGAAYDPSEVTLELLAESVARLREQP